MQKLISLLNVVLILGLIVTASAPPGLVATQGSGGTVDDGSGGSWAPSTAVGEVSASGEQVPSTQELPSYMELVFMSNRTGWDIHKWKDNATTQLTFDPAIDWTPRAAPGGGRVAFVSHRDGNAEIYVVDFDGTNERRLTNNTHEDWYPSWSPSGNRLVFSSDRDGFEEIYVMDLTDPHRKVTRLTDNFDDDSEPAYSPDGKQIIFSKLDPLGDYDIWIMNADGSQQRALIANPAIDDYYPTWSPDGKKIVFTRFDPAIGNEEIFEHILATGVTNNLTNNPANDWAPVVSPDGKWIAFSSAGRTPVGDEEVWVMPAAGGAGNETNVSNNPAANDRYPDFFWPRLPAPPPASAPPATLLPWEFASTWVRGRVPDCRDRVLIPAQATATVGNRVKLTTGTRKLVMDLTVNGTLQGTCDVHIQALRGITVGRPTGWIEAEKHGTWKWGCKVALEAWPDGTITINGVVKGGDGAGRPLDPAWGEDGGPVDLLAKNVFITNGAVSGGKGGDLGRHWRDRAGNGGNVTVRGETIRIGFGGSVSGGNGGDTNPDFTSPTDSSGVATHAQDGGNGGSVFLGSGATAIYGGTRELRIGGSVSGGKGGDVTGPHKGRGGRGGDVKLNVQWGVWGELTTIAFSTLSGGNGGGWNPPVRTPPITPLGPVLGGNGGHVVKLVSFSGSMAGATNGGIGGRGWRDGDFDPDLDGFDGNVTTHPPSLTFDSTAAESGRNVWIYGGEGWGIDLSQVQPGAITATKSITVAVGSGGQIDLRGHGASENVLSAGQGIFLYADSGQILLDPGVSVADLTSPDAQVSPARVIYRGLLYAEGDTTVLAGASAVISLMLTNAGSGADTFQLAITDTGGWSWQLSPGSLSLESMAEGVIAVTAIVPPEDVGLLNEVTFSAHSTADPSQTAVVNLALEVVERPKVYLPLTLRNSTPGQAPPSTPLYFDDFSDPNSGWPVVDYSNVATDYNNGNYRIQIKEDELFVWVSPLEPTYPNGTFEVEAWRSTGGNSTYGIVFGLDGSAGEFYVFEIQPYLQQYRLTRRDSDGWVTLIPYTDSSHINFNMAHNQLRVTRDGSQIELYVNNHHLVSYSDSTYTDSTRRVGIYARSGPESPVWLRYDDFTIWGPGYGTRSVTEGDSVGVGARGETPEPWAPAVEP